MIVAGEKLQGDVEPVHLPVSVAAIIALSPYADFSGSTFSTRYQSIVMPVLSVSGDYDTDTAGVVSSPSVRKAPFEYMPSHDAYLLWLSNAPHAELSGSIPAVAGATIETGTGQRNDGPGSRKGSLRREKRHSGNGQYGTTKEGSNNAGAGGGRPSGIAASPTERAVNTSLIQAVSTAFLDAFLKHDSIARKWLNKSAGRWIGDRGELKRK